MLLLAPGVLAIGVGERTTPAGAESLARSALRGRPRAHRAGGADRAGPGDHAPGHGVHDGRPGRRGDVPGGAGHAVRLPAAVRRRRAACVVDGPVPFLEAAAEAMGIDRLRVIDTGLDPVTAEREQWDDGNNTLAVGARAWSSPTSATWRPTRAWRTRASRCCGSAARSWARGRGGPRCMSCPIDRAPWPEKCVT